MTRREERLQAEARARLRYPLRVQEARTTPVLRGMIRSAVGLKRWFIPGSEFEGQGTLTAYASGVLRRRRAANRVAKASRKRNRGR